MSDTMSETEQDAQTEDTQEVEPGTVNGGHSFNVGDEASVIRGKLRGRKGNILAFNPGDKTYAITLDGGTLAVVNAANLKAPQDSTVSVQALVSVLRDFRSEDEGLITRLASALDAVTPGISAKLNEATAS